MDLKHTLTFFGLLSDLVGAMLLSIPMIWDTRAAAHSILKMMKRIRFWLYGYSNRETNIKLTFSRDVQEVRARIVPVGAFFVLCFGAIGFQLIKVFASATFSSSLPFDASPFWVVLIMCTGVICVVAALYYLGRSPLYVARAPMWIARGNHERRIGFVGLGVLCIGFVFQAAVNLM